MKAQWHLHGFLLDDGFYSAVAGAPPWEQGFSGSASQGLKTIAPSSSPYRCLSLTQGRPLAIVIAGNSASSSTHPPWAPYYCTYPFIASLVLLQYTECFGRFWGLSVGVGSGPLRARYSPTSLRRPLAPRCPDWAKLIFASIPHVTGNGRNRCQIQSRLWRYNV